ncbi:MAG: DUF58 domain-containing protein [Saprospiraceae bacterium]|nr:DUF58 domain-containing protein [Saprospiraceae bacterium]
MTTSEILKKVRRIEIKSRKISDHLFAGEYHSAFKGQGMSFSEVRAYTYGDDVRNIDWNVTARAGDTFIKTFEEERELTVMLLIDVSESLNFGTSDTFKKDYLLEIAAVLAFSASDNRDKIGALLFSDRIEAYIPPQKGRKNVLKLIRELLVSDAKDRKTDLSQALDYFYQMQKRKCIAFVLSDFISSDYSLPLSMCAKKHDIIGIKISDHGEAVAPGLGLIEVMDPETGKKSLLDTSSASFAQWYESSFLKKDEQDASLFKKSSARYLSLKTGDDYVKALVGLFKRKS